MPCARGGSNNTALLEIDSEGQKRAAFLSLLA